MIVSHTYSSLQFYCFQAAEETPPKPKVETKDEKKQRIVSDCFIGKKLMKCVPKAMAALL